MKVYVELDEKNFIIGFYATPSFEGQPLVELPDDFKSENKKFKFIDGEVITDSKYLTKERLKQIEIDLKLEDLIFTQKGEILKESNGKPYKVRYANDYQTLVIPSFMDDLESKDIWDATELEFVSMTKSEVQTLYEFLKSDYEAAFQERKTNRAKLLKEILELKNGGMENA